MKIGRHRFPCRLAERDDPNYSWMWWKYEKVLPTSLGVKIERLEGRISEVGFHLQEPSYTPLSNNDPVWAYLIHERPDGVVKYLYFKMPWPHWGDFLRMNTDKLVADTTISWLKYGF